MYVVSCRRDFESNIHFSKVPLYRNYTNPASHKEFQEITIDPILAAATGKHVCLLVHGFNNPIENVAKSYWALVSGLDKPGLNGVGGYGLVVGFTWPGSRTGIGYFGAPRKADKAASDFLDLINALRAVAMTVDVQTHSLGARVALRALEKPGKTFVSNLMMAAPAVDDNILEPRESFFDSTISCERCIVYHSKEDSVLKTFPIPDAFDGIHGALGRKGPRRKAITLEKTPNVYVVDCTARVKKEHGGYRKTPQYFEHWKVVLSGAPLNRYDALT